MAMTDTRTHTRAHTRTHASLGTPVRTVQPGIVLPAPAGPGRTRSRTRQPSTADLLRIVGSNDKLLDLGPSASACTRSPIPLASTRA